MQALVSKLHARACIEVFEQIMKLLLFVCWNCLWSCLRV